MKSVITIFYSWQSDDSRLRNFIERTLEKTVKELNIEQESYEYRIDRDTRGESGSPRIAQTIEEKIKRADIFVGDVSIVDASEERSYPNSNVMLETGYAIMALGEKRTILLFDEEKGKREDLPFDLRQRRISGFRTDKKEDFTKLLKEAILAATKSASIAEKIKKDTGYEIDEEEIDVLRLIDSTERKQLTIVRTMAGPIMMVNSAIGNKALYNKIDGWNKTRLTANLESLTKKEMLRHKATDGHTDQYSLAKRGFQVCDAL